MGKYVNNAVMKIQTDNNLNSINAEYIVTEVMGDTYDDAGLLKEKYYRWLFRIWISLTFSFLRKSRTVILPVAPGTKTIRLPVDYLDFIFLGYPDGCGHDMPMAVNRNLALQVGVETPGVCKSCGNKDLCSLDTETIEETVTINGTDYIKKTTRVILPDGSYREEVTQPFAVYADPSSSYITGVDMQTTSKVVCQLEKSCPDCVPATADNLATLAGCGCTDAVCSCCTTDNLPYDVKPSNAHYNLFEQEGFIQFSPDSCINQVKLRYVSAGVCVDGVYYFPIYCMETLIAGTYYRSIEKKKNVPQVEKDRARRAYSAERKELLRHLTRQSYQEWLELFDIMPRIPSL